jgi:hypothetical protein
MKNQTTINGKKNTKWACVLAGLLAPLALAATQTNAAAIHFHGDTSGSTGTGFGNVLEVLALQNKDTESGSILWNGTKDVSTGDATNQSQTRTVAELTAKGIDSTNFDLIFNLDQTGSNPALDLHNFSLVFQNAAGTTLFTAAFDPTDLTNASTLGLTPAGQGVGTSGYEFPVTFTAAEATLFFGTSTNRVGQIIPTAAALDNTTNGGPDGFYIGKDAAVPEPTSLAMLALGGAALLVRRPKRSVNP